MPISDSRHMGQIDPTTKYGVLKMKTLMKLANACNKAYTSIAGNIVFEGNAARATDGETHAVIASGPWSFDSATVVSVHQIKMAMALSKKPVWSGDTLNGVKLVNVGDANDWPALPCDQMAMTRINAPTLADAIARTLPAAADSDIRYYLNGICFDFGQKAIVGCDGHRLHIVRNCFESSLSGQAIVPRYAFDLVGAKNVLHLDFTATHYRLSYVGGFLIGRLIDGKFPDFDRVICSDSSRPNVVPFNGTQIAACKVVAGVTKAAKVKFPTVVIDADGTLKACDITVPCFERFAVTELEGEKWKSDGEYHGQKFYGVNVEYLHDAMQCAEHGTIASDTCNDSLLIRNGDFTAVVMPCRI